MAAAARLTSLSASVSLTFHNTRRTVQTASTIQVRKPLSAKSIGRWKSYRDHLRPLLKALQAP